MPLIALEKVSKTYNSEMVAVNALREITLTIAAGEFLCIAGPSGSGKSTLLNLLGILDFPSQGTVRIDGRPTSGLSRTAAAIMRREMIGFVFQSFNLIPVLSAWENIEYSLILRKIPSRQQREIIAQTLAAVGLQGKSDRKVALLSGGEQQRVAIARAIAGNPKVVLADEPTANLDTATGLAIIKLFQQLNKERGTTFVFSSHDPRISALASRGLTLVDGRLSSPAAASAAEESSPAESRQNRNHAHYLP